MTYFKLLSKQLSWRSKQLSYFLPNHISLGRVILVASTSSRLDHTIFFFLFQSRGRIICNLVRIANIEILSLLLPWVTLLWQEMILSSHLNHVCCGVSQLPLPLSYFPSKHSSLSCNLQPPTSSASFEPATLIPKPSKGVSELRLGPVPPHLFSQIHWLCFHKAQHNDIFSDIILFGPHLLISQPSNIVKSQSN